MSDSVTQLEVVTTGLAFPEAPRWHAGRLWFSDMHSGMVVAMTEAGDCSVVAEVEGLPSGLGWLPAGDLLVVSMLDRRVLRLTEPGLVVHADLADHAPWHCNDMVVDAAGRAYVGNFGFNEANPTFESTAIHLVEPDGTVRIAADGLMFPNGMVINPDGATLIVAETYSERLTAFDIGPDGTLTGRRPFARLDEEAPDGICLDEQGAVWVASPPAKAVLRVAPGGVVTARIPTGDSGAYACALGGADRRTLYVCTAPTSVPEEATRLRGGRIERARVDVPGAGLP